MHIVCIILLRLRKFFFVFFLNKIVILIMWIQIILFGNNKIKCLVWLQSSLSSPIYALFFLTHELRQHGYKKRTISDITFSPSINVGETPMHSQFSFNDNLVRLDSHLPNTLSKSLKFSFYTKMGYSLVFCFSRSPDSLRNNI